MQVKNLDPVIALDIDSALESAQPARNKDGIMQEMTFLGTKLREGSCLKLTEKKGYLISYEEVQPEDIPEEVRYHLGEF